MIRAGFIRKLASGTYTYLPLGWRSLLKIIADRPGGDERRRGAGNPHAHPPAAGAVAADRARRGVSRTSSAASPTTTGARTCWRRRPRRSSPRWWPGRSAATSSCPINLYQIHDEVPRRVPPAVRRHPQPGVPDEGRLQLRRDGRGPERLLPQDVRRLLPHLRPLRAEVRDRRGRLRRHGRQRHRGVHGALDGGRRAGDAPKTAATPPTSTRPRWTRCR